MEISKFQNFQNFRFSKFLKFRYSNFQMQIYQNRNFPNTPKISKLTNFRNFPKTSETNVIRRVGTTENHELRHPKSLSMMFSETSKKILSPKNEILITHFSLKPKRNPKNFKKSQIRSVKFIITYRDSFVN